MQSYNESEFMGKVNAALARVKTILENTRNPQYAADVPHRYDDKYLLAEFLTRASIASLFQCLGNLGLSPEALGRLRAWARTRSVSLRLKAREDCRFLREETRKIESAQEYVTETRSFLGTKSTKTEKVVTTVTEYFWGFDFHYELIAFQGSSEDNAVTLITRRGSVEIKTGAKNTPRPQTVVRPPIDVNITWLLTHLDAESRAGFSIDRTRPDCHTPRRNPEIDEALESMQAFEYWCSRVRAYFLGELFPAQVDHGLDLNAIRADEIFVPVLPLFESATNAAGASESSVLPLAYLDAFLAEQQRSLARKCLDLTKVFPSNATVITAVEASLLVILLHASHVCQHFWNGVAYIEQMLRDQLIAAIGKEVTPVEFGSYMDFHARKLFKPEYRPVAFSHAVRRPAHDPEGVLSIESAVGTAMPDPVSTLVAHSIASRPMSFALDASTRVSFRGDRYLHAWVSHQFSDTKGLALSLVARARQFSSFVLLVGRIASADVFEPKYGIIVQNKDLLKIPLLLEQIPSPKEFRDAIASLSPEQQRFAKAFRGMQLESTLFGVCVVQIKPQLEKLLKLPPDSLTKEIKLTQELLNLFIEYQLPSDLLSYDGPDEASPADKLARVKEYVARMQEMIELSKKKQLDEARERENFRLAEMNQTRPPMPLEDLSFGGGGLPPGMYAAAAPMGGPPGFGPPPPMSAPSPGGGSAMPVPRAAAPARPAPAPSPASQSAPVVKAAPPAPSPAESRPAATQPAQPARSHETSGSTPRGDTPEGGDAMDYTRIPGDLDKRVEALDEEGALRPTILNPGEVWTRTAQKGLLDAPATATLQTREQKDEKHKAFDLLDALSKSGALAIDDASLHVVIAATHCFDRTLVDTVIQGNVNPIEKVERSLMIVATTIHRTNARELLAEDQRERFLSYSPQLGTSATERAGDLPERGSREGQ